MKSLNIDHVDQILLKPMLTLPKILPVSQTLPISLIKLQVPSGSPLQGMQILET